MIIKTILFASAALMPVLAQAAPQCPRGCSEGRNAAQRARMMERFDSNKDGKLDKSERQAMRKEISGKRNNCGMNLKEIVSSADTNRDGKLDESELARVKKAYERLAIKKYDTNNDGVIDAQEQLALKPNMARLMKKFDANKDGKIDATEHAAMQEAQKAKRLEQQKKQLAKLDTNGNGVIDKEEREAFQAAQKAKRKANHLKRFDSNGDGVLDAEEKKAMRKQHLKGKAKRVQCRLNKADFKNPRALTGLMIDRNKDGVLSENELENFKNKYEKYGKNRANRAGKHANRGGKRAGCAAKKLAPATPATPAPAPAPATGVIIGTGVAS